MGQKIYKLAIPQLIVKEMSAIVDATLSCPLLVEREDIANLSRRSLSLQPASAQVLFRGQATIGKGAWGNHGGAAGWVFKKKPVARDEASLGMAGE